MGARTRIESADGVAHIRLDDGKVNAMSFEMISEISQALDVAEKNGAIAVLHGREGLFSAGFDLGTFARGLDATIEMLDAGCRLIQRLLAFPRPVVTVCTGHAYPAGAFLMLAADLRLGISGPWRIGMNEVAIGLTVPRFALELARHRLTPPGFARVNTGRMFEPGEALRLGYLDRVVEPEALDAALAEELDQLRQLHMEHVAATKLRANGPALQAIARAFDEDLAAARPG